MLATLGVPFDPRAEEVAIAAAVESARRLVVVNVVEVLLTSFTSLRPGSVPQSDADARRIARPAKLAASLGVEVERYRVGSPRPVEALLELLDDHDPGLLVFGPERARLRRRTYGRAARALRERATCLVWLPE